MSDYTPDNYIVRTRYATYGNVPDELWETAISVHGPEFDRWLEAHDREVAAKAWEEGFRDARKKGEYGIYQHYWIDSNPYKNGDTL